MLGSGTKKKCYPTKNCTFLNLLTYINIVQNFKISKNQKYFFLKTVKIYHWIQKNSIFPNILTIFKEKNLEIRKNICTFATEIKNITIKKSIRKI